MPPTSKVSSMFLLIISSLFVYVLFSKLKCSVEILKC